MDLDATIAACRALHVRFAEIIKREIALIKRHDIGLIVGDIPPLCFEIAARVSIPSVAITNFTWNWIYRAHLGDYPAFLPLIEEMEGFYSKATLALTLPYPCNMGIFPQQEPIPWIARASILTKEEARSHFDLPQSANIVLLSFGGLGLRGLPWDKLKQLREFHFVSTGETHLQESNLIVLSNAQSEYQDLVRSADVIVTKPGYGIVADAIAQRLPMLYTERGVFPEYPRLVEALSDCAVAEFIPQDELMGGNLGPYLNSLLSREAKWPEVSLGGAQTAAKKILENFSL